MNRDKILFIQCMIIIKDIKMKQENESIDLIVVDMKKVPEKFK